MGFKRNNLNLIMTNKNDTKDFKAVENYFNQKELIYEKVGSSWLLDSIYLFVISPISLIGFILNICCFFVLLPKLKIKQTKLYKYLRIYSLNSSLICFLHVFLFISFSPRYFDIAFEYVARFYRCKVLGYFCVCLYLFGNMLDILIALDRISIYLNGKLDKFNQMKPYTKCFCLFIICMLTNLPILLSITVYINDDLTDLNKSIYLNCIQTDFMRTKFGMILNLALIFTRDILTLIFELSCFGLLFYYYKYATIQFKKYYVSQARSVSMNLSKLKKKNYRGRKLLLMSIYFSIISIVLHTIFLITTFIALFLQVEDSIRFAFIILTLVVSIILKHFLNVFILYKFNFN